ncbi:anti-sigma factor family protein [Aeromicrobium sp. P5_D10]
MHLGDDVAAFVDGQLSGPAMHDAATHLESCDACERAVRQQRLLKSRMSTVEAPEPPAALLASLAGLASAPPPRERWLERVGRLVPVRLGVILVGASLAVVAAAYVVGGTETRVGDEVAPSYDGYVADFVGATTVQAGATISESDLHELNASGWPCHETLAGDLHRTSGAYADEGRAVVLSYTDGQSRLTLIEQNGALEPESLEDFATTTMAGARVWIRQGNPFVVTWDDQGTVYTIVTDVDRARLERVVSELPTARPSSGPIGRVGDGLDRMTSWMGAA